MDFWIENKVLKIWLSSREIEYRVIASDVIDGDLNPVTGEWLIVRSDGLVYSLNARLFMNIHYSTKGVRARWSGDDVRVLESDNTTRIYNYRGFLKRVM